MRYLYTDSKPFPLTFDFLVTLEAFMTAATRVVQLESDSARQGQALLEVQQDRGRSVDMIEGLHQALLVSIGQVMSAAGPRGTVSDVEPPAGAQEYAQRMKDYSARLIQEKRQFAKAATDKENAELFAENERRAADIKQHLDHFFRVAQLPVLTSRISLKLDNGKEPRAELGVVFRNQGEVVTSFILSAQNHPVWAGARKVSEFITGLDLTVGAKKSFFKSVVSPELVHLDDYFISRADVHGRGGEIALRKRPELRESYIFKIQKSEKGLSGEFEHPDDPNSKALSPALAPEDAVKVDALCQAIRQSFSELFAARESVVRIDLDGKDVYKNHLGIALVSRLVKTFAPIVEEITTRSPSEQELSLKREDDTGKREELYLRREELLKKLQPLNAEGRGYFAPLGLDDWVPTLTVRPPDVG